MKNYSQEDNVFDLFENICKELHIYDDENTRDVYVYPKIPAYIESMALKNFGINNQNERILYFRDTSSFNKQNQGIILTNSRFVNIPDNSYMSDKTYSSWDLIDNVEYDSSEECLYVYFNDGDDPYTISILDVAKDISSKSKRNSKGQIFASLFTSIAKFYSDDDYYESDDDYEKEDFMMENEELEEYTTRYKYFSSNLNAIMESEDSVLKFATLFSPGNSKEAAYKQNLLGAMACLIYSANNKNSNIGCSEILNKGLQLARKAQGCNFGLITPEVKMVQTIINILQLDTSSDHIISRYNKVLNQWPGEWEFESCSESDPEISNLYNKEWFYKTREECLFDSFSKAANSLIEKGKLKEADSIFKKMLTLDDQNFKITAYLRLGLLSENKEESFQFIKKSVELRDFNEEVENKKNIFYQNWLLSVQMLSDMYLYGKGVAKDYSKAYCYAMKAAENGNPYAMVSLATIYENGLGREKNVKEALRWYNKVLQNGIKDDELLNYVRNRIKDLSSCHSEIENSCISSDSYSCTSSSRHVTTETATNTSETNLSNEKIYVEQVKACLEESRDIDSSTRNLLDKIRIRMGITIQRAEELEASIHIMQLNAEERDYLSEYRDSRDSDGCISPIKRKLLECLRIASGISKERAYEIEENA